MQLKCLNALRYNANLGRDELHNATKQNILQFFEVKNDLNMFCDIVMALLVR